MPTLTEIKQRLSRLEQEQGSPLISAIVAQLKQQNYHAQFAPETVAQFCHRFNLTPVELALHSLPLAACYALAPISRFYVGAIAIGQSGHFYFGANQEFGDVAIQQTVHAEQSAISHAWIADERYLTDIVVNYTPCGHCRQFMNELNSAKTLKIHLPHCKNNCLHSYLPDAFGPQNLNITRVLFDPQDHHISHKGDALQSAAIAAMNSAYAPYSNAPSGVALQADTHLFIGRYAENAAFNPSFLPLQCALNSYRLSGCDKPIQRIVMCEKQAILSHKQITENLAKHYLNCEVEYLSIS